MLAVGAPFRSMTSITGRNRRVSWPKAASRRRPLQHAAESAGEISQSIGARNMGVARIERCYARRDVVSRIGAVPLLTPLLNTSRFRTVPPSDGGVGRFLVASIHFALGFFVFSGLVTPAEGRREYIHVGLTAASLLPTPPTDATRPLRLTTEKTMWAVYSGRTSELFSRRGSGSKFLRRGRGRPNNA